MRDGRSNLALMAPGSEARSEMPFGMPEKKLLDATEIATHMLHNTYTRCAMREAFDDPHRPLGCRRFACCRVAPSTPRLGRLPSPRECDGPRAKPLHVSLRGAGDRYARGASTFRFHRGHICVIW